MSPEPRLSGHDRSIYTQIKLYDKHATSKLGFDNSFHPPVYLVRLMEAATPFQYPIRRPVVKSREVSKLRDWQFKLLHRFKIWQAHGQHCCRGVCQISDQSDNSIYKSRGFETLRDHSIRRLIGYWNRAQATHIDIRDLDRHSLLGKKIAKC